MTLVIPDHDDTLTSLASQDLVSTREQGVRFRIGSLLGSGSMGIAYFGMRHSKDGKSPVVLKMFRPQYVLEAGATAALVVRKEATALARLNGRVPPTPFVVRMIDVGTVPIIYCKKELELPWLALEYVHGGAEGTTLTERVAYEVHGEGHAFHPARAALALECIARGLEAVHEVGVIHRDITPNNVLCCGSGEQEIFKITDFGLARPLGLTATFGGIVVGTVGYAPPEQATLDDRKIGTWSDVFTLAVDVYFMLTGRNYFPTSSALDSLQAIREPERKSVRDSSLLHPDLKDNPAACAGIDLALKLATAFRAEERPRTAQMFAATLLPWLKSTPRSRPMSKRVESVVPALAPTQRAPGALRWTVRHRSADELIVRSVAWDGDGRCLAATNQGLSFWNGTAWEAAPVADLPNPTGIRFVQRMAAGSWLVGGDEATMATYAAGRVSEVVRGPSPHVSFSHASGDFDDLAVMVGEVPERPPVLYALSSRRWLKPHTLHDVARVSALARLNDAEWLLVGRRVDGAGFAAIYRPLMWETQELDIPRVRALLSCASRPEAQVAVATGSEGLIVCMDHGELGTFIMRGKPDLPAAAVDVTGGVWASGASGIWVREAGSETFEQAWQDPEWTTPIVSLFADVGLVIALAADGGIVEGRRDTSLHDG